MIINGKNVMTSGERVEIVELLVENGFYRSMLNSCTDKQLAEKLRYFRQECSSKSKTS
jgi:hypothetical protein